MFCHIRHPRGVDVVARHSGEGAVVVDLKKFVQLFL